MDCDKLDELAIDLVDPDGADADRRALGRAGRAAGRTEPSPIEEAVAHVASCARCAALVERLRAGLRAADELPLDEPSSLLEARILAAAAAARPPVSFSRRLARAVSTVGGWAMRPQVAMAAVLVLMVGSSILVLRGGSLPGARRMKVTEEGTPVATLELPEESPPAALPPGAKGKPAPKKEAPAAPPPPPEAKKAEAQVEAKPSVPSDLPLATEAAPEESALDGLVAAGSGGAAVEAAKGGPVAAPKVAPPAPAATAAPMVDSEAEASNPLGKSTKSATAAPAQASTFDDAMVAYQEGRWAAAANGFDAAAAAGQRPSTSLLYAARSHRALGSCAQALVRYRKLLGAHPASPEAPNAALEGGRCAKANGDLVEARALFERARGWPSTKSQAEAELAALDTPPPAKAKAAKPSAAAGDAP